MNAAFGIAISNYVAQNYGAGLWDRIRKGTAACLLQTSIANALMCVMIIFGRHLVVPMFVTQPTAEIIWYSDYYLMTVAPFTCFLECCRSIVLPSRVWATAGHPLQPVSLN